MPVPVPVPVADISLYQPQSARKCLVDLALSWDSSIMSIMVFDHTCESHRQNIKHALFLLAGVWHSVG